MDVKACDVITKAMTEATTIYNNNGRFIQTIRVDCSPDTFGTARFSGPVIGALFSQAR